MGNRVRGHKYPGGLKQLGHQAVYRPGPQPHEGGCGQRLDKDLDIPGPAGKNPGHHHQIQRHAQGEAQDVPHGGPVDADGGLDHHVVVGNDLYHASRHHDDHRQAHKAVCLENGVAHQHHAHEQGGQAQSGQQRTGQLGIQVGEDEDHDGLAQDKQPHRHGTGGQSGDPQGGAGDPPRPPAVPAGQRPGDGGNDGGRDGGHQGGGQIIDVQGAGVVAVQGAADVLQGGVELQGCGLQVGEGGLLIPQGLGLGRVLVQQGHGDGAAIGQGGLPGGQGLLQGGEVHKVLIQGPGVLVLQQGPLELSLDQGGVDDGDDAHHGGTDGDGDGDHQQVLEDGGRLVGPVVGQLGLLAAGDQKVHQHIGQGHDGAHRHACDGAGGGVAGVRPVAHQPVGQPQAHGELAQGLDDLGDGGGGHVPVPLGIAPEGGQAAHADHRRSQGPDAGGGHAVVHQAGQLFRAEEHHQEGQDPQDQEQGQGQPEGAAHLVPAAQSVSLAHQLGHRHGQARGGDGEQDGVDVIGVVEVGGALLPDDVQERDLVEHADELDHQNAYGQDCGSAEKGVGLGRTGHPARGLIVLRHSETSLG